MKKLSRHKNASYICRVEMKQLLTIKFFKMITGEMFLEALQQIELASKTIKEAGKIIEAYTMQFDDNAKPKDKYKDKSLLVVGNEVECTEVHGNSKGTLTKGNVYEVVRTKKQNLGGLYFFIRNDQGKLREYNEKNSQFKALK